MKNRRLPNKVTVKTKMYTILRVAVPLAELSEKVLLVTARRPLAGS